MSCGSSGVGGAGSIGFGRDFEGSNLSCHRVDGGHVVVAVDR